MPCNCGKTATGQPRVWTYTAADGKVTTGSEVQVKAAQIRDQRAGKPAGRVTAR